ncbi:hypothetical protein SAMN05216599_11587 [Pseudomonas cichorii]|nr:hypothetical protein SAMN05216599_11587 [Pseudomonas cichorii]
MFPDSWFGLRPSCAFTARHFGFGKSNQSHCSGSAPPQDGAEPERMVFPPFLPKQKGAAVKAEHKYGCDLSQCGFFQLFHEMKRGSARAWGMLEKRQVAAILFHMQTCPVDALGNVS